ncbi:hypothetical protein [Chlorogloeopsis sp. ULAP01]|uniref:hypothetical protein n=1 Tax=Chlorogloeopsis sp. ULAP01 TaxID=3056483 RepID=UPI0025ACBE66|nr:hypothetical protein [Chlorogloeopsis sp. ULAP01]
MRGLYNHDTTARSLPDNQAIAQLELEQYNYALPEILVETRNYPTGTPGVYVSPHSFSTDVYSHILHPCSCPPRNKFLG